jgi:hypothetical protein
MYVGKICPRPEASCVDVMAIRWHMSPLKRVTPQESGSQTIDHRVAQELLAH